MNTEILMDLDRQLVFIHNRPVLWRKLERFCFKLEEEWLEKSERERQIKEEKNKKRIEEVKKRHELMWAKQKALKQQAKDKAQMKKANDIAQKIDKYRRMEFSVLLKDYLNLYFLVKICGKGSSGDYQLLNMIRREVSEFRSQPEQEEFNHKVQRLKEANRTSVLRELGVG